jgi:hypothetical protein
MWLWCVNRVLIALGLLTASLEASEPVQRDHSITAPLPDWAAAQIQRDLAPYADGISKAQLDQICRWENEKFVVEDPYYSKRPDHIARIQIRDQQIKNPAPETPRHWLAQQRLDDIIQALHKILLATPLPDLDLIITMDDVQLQHGPIFCASKPIETRAILWPDHEMLSRYPVHQLESAFAREVPWEEKRSELIWRGTTTGGAYQIDSCWKYPRTQLVMLSLKHPSLIDARFTNTHQTDPNVAEVFRQLGMVADFMSIADQLKYRYQIDVDGNSCTYSHFYWLLRSECTPLKAPSGHLQWYYGGLQPWVHYVPVRSDYADLPELLQTLREDPDLAHQIALAGRQFALESLSETMALRYIYHSLIAYSKLLNIPAAEVVPTPK